MCSSLGTDQCIIVGDGLGFGDINVVFHFGKHINNSFIHVAIVLFSKEMEQSTNIFSDTEKDFPQEDKLISSEMPYIVNGRVHIAGKELIKEIHSLSLILNIKPVYSYCNAVSI